MPSLRSAVSIRYTAEMKLRGRLVGPFLLVSAATAPLCAVAAERADTLIRHVVTSSPVAGPAPPSVAPPQMQGGDSDLYTCSMGTAVNFASAHAAFRQKHGSVDGGQSVDFQAPVARRLSSPELPEGAPRPGYTSLLVALGPDGAVVDALLECSTDSALNDSVSAAVRSSVFDPAIAGGETRATVVRVEYWIARF